MKTIDKSKFKNLNIVSILKTLIAVALSALTVVLVVTFTIQIIASFYQSAAQRGMTIFDLTVISTFTGAVNGVIISKFVSIYRVIRKALDFRKKGDSDK